MGSVTPINSSVQLASASTGGTWLGNFVNSFSTSSGSWLSKIAPLVSMGGNPLTNVVNTKGQSVASSASGIGLANIGLIIFGGVLILIPTMTALRGKQPIEVITKATK